MPIPYEHGNWNAAKPVNASYIEYPFIEQGDNTAKVYHLVCQINRDAYAPIALDAPMSNATSAGVTALPFTADPNAIFVGDSTPRPIDGGVVEFERKFATVPATHNVYEDIVVNMPKAFEDDTNNVLFDGGPFPMVARIERQFDSNVSNLTRTKKFKVTLDGFEVNFVRDNIGATVPNRTNFYSNTEVVAEITSISRYLGNIYVSETPYIKPANAYSAT